MRNDLKITTAMAAALLTAACSQSDNGWGAADNTAICTDRTGRRIADTNCGRGGMYAGAHGGGGWYYVQRNGTIPYYGERATGGSYARTSGVSYFAAPTETAVTRSAAVSRGGFGSIGEGHGGGAGE